MIPYTQMVAPIPTRNTKCWGMQWSSENHSRMAPFPPVEHVEVLTDESSSVSSTSSLRFFPLDSALLLVRVAQGTTGSLEGMKNVNGDNAPAAMQSFGSLEEYCMSAKVWMMPIEATPVAVPEIAAVLTAAMPPNTVTSSSSIFV